MGGNDVLFEIEVGWVVGGGEEELGCIYGMGWGVLFFYG